MSGLEERWAAEPLVGWRVWRVRDGYLLSLTRDIVWPLRQPLAAKCARGSHGHRISSDDLTCRVGPDYWPHIIPVGVFAFAQPIGPDLYGHAVQVVGQVALWGVVIEHELGYRAQYAYPQRLYMASGLEFPGINYATDDEVRLVAARYGVDVGRLSDLGIRPEFEGEWS